MKNNAPSDLGEAPACLATVLYIFKHLSMRRTQSGKKKPTDYYHVFNGSGCISAVYVCYV